jgi:hypothetical protein
MTDAAEQFAVDYLKQHSLRTERFSKQEMRLGKTPDFRVFSDSSLVAYCEAKQVQHDEWLNRQFEAAEPLQFVGGLRPEKVFNRLTTHIHRAAQQFAAVNLEHKHSNILVFANFDQACEFQDQLLGVLTGNIYAEYGIFESIFNEYSNGRIMYEKMTIDIYVWCDGWKSDPKPRHWFWHNSPHYANVCAILRTDPALHVRLPPS